MKGDQIGQPSNGGLFWRHTLSHALSELARHRLAAMLLLYLLVVLAMLSPLASDRMPNSPAQDLANHVSGIIEARSALAEGQFPIRVAPTQLNGERYPIFQFYGNLPYTIGGLLYLATDLSPYLAWKIIVAISLFIGGFFTYRCAAKLTRQRTPAIAAGLIFITAPYFLNDIYGRFAYPEIVSFGLLPVVFFYAQRSFMSRKIIYIPISAIAWTCLALSHNITYLYASIFFSLYFISFTTFKTAYLWRMIRLGSGYTAGLLMTAWYVVPQLILLPFLRISTIWGDTTVYSVSWLTPLRDLLAPTFVAPTPPPPLLLNNSYFSLQIGWPILIAAGLAIYCLIRPTRLSRYSYFMLVRLLLFLGLAFFMVWTPFDFWSYLPKILSYVQFSYRLLMFVVLWGALIAAYGLAYAFRRRLRFRHVIALAAVLAIYVIPYLAPHPPSKQIFVANEVSAPNMGRGAALIAYAILPATLMKTSLVHEDVNLAEPEYSIISPASLLLYPGTGKIPAPKSGDSLLIAGYVPIQHMQPVTLTVSINGQIIATRLLKLNGFKISLPIDGSFSGDQAEIKLQTDRYLDQIKLKPAPARLGSLALVIRELYLKRSAAQTKTTPFMPASVVRKTQLTTSPTTYSIHNQQSSLIQLPVRFYPNMLQVRDNGEVIEYGNTGRFIALNLSQGDHIIDVQFNGVGWANVISLLAWLAIIVMYIFFVAKSYLWPAIHHSTLPAGI